MSGWRFVVVSTATIWFVFIPWLVGAIIITRRWFGL